MNRGRVGVALVWVLALLWAGASAWAHEPYLQVTANADGTFTAEAGFSDGSDVAGLKLLVRSRASGETLSEQVLPVGGKLTIPVPAVPYRVTFDGGPGHKVSKLGPERLAAVEPTAAIAVASSEPVAQAAAKAEVAGHRHDEPELSRTLLVVALMFLLAVVSFALGYAAASRRTTQR